MEYSTEDIAKMELADVDALKKEGAEKILDGLKLLEEARKTCRYRAELYREKAELMGGRMNSDALPLIIAAGNNNTEASELIDIWCAFHRDGLHDTLSKMAVRRNW